MKRMTMGGMAAAVLAGATTAWAAGPMVEGWMITTGSFNIKKVHIPDGDPSGGISHDLEPGDWQRFRVKIDHSDSNNGPFYSADFAPTAADIQTCDGSGCEAPPVVVGTENLDWEDGSKITFYLEARECLGCGWVSFEAEQQ